VEVRAWVAVIVVVPPPTIEIWPVEEFTVATFVFELAYDHVPPLSDVGGVGTNGSDAIVLFGIVKAPRVGGINTLRVVVPETAVKFGVSTWEAVNVVVPVPVMVTRPVDGSIVATEVFELLYVNGAELFDVGSVGVKGTSSRFFTMAPVRK
jgi:hypothetical protein